MQRKSGKRSPWAWLLASGTLLVLACSGQRYTFVPERSCGNGVIDGDETGEDCGGSCEPCRDDQPCLIPADCESKVCGADQRCARPSCDDGVRNGDEPDQDCGGSFCDVGCAVDSPCTEAADCESGACDPMTLTCVLNCPRGTDECDGNTDDACETNLLMSAENCGACGRACDLSHAEARCAGGACQIAECLDPWIRCNTDDDDGCEVNSSTDAQNCGGCGMVCTSLHGSPSCVNSRCVIECADGFGDCDKDARTGCETVLTDVDNCGACDRKCPDTQGEPYCVDGECGVASCEEGRGDCDGDEQCETNLADDPNNCGRCGRVCSAANGSAVCMEGRCVISACEAGWENCDESEPDGGFASGCETNVSDSVEHCGSCTGVCSDDGAILTSCSDGACDPPQCDENRDNCDGENEDGCETDLTAPTACGECGNVCDSKTPHCVATRGEFDCQAQIVTVGDAPYTTGQVVGGTLTLKFTPRAGTDRLVLLGVVSESANNGIAGARPDIVRFGQTNMIAGPAQAGAIDWWSPDLFLYYLPLGDAAADGSELDVFIDGSFAPAVSGLMVQLLQLNGVRQTMPISASSGAVAGNPDTPDPSTIGLTLPITTSGSVIYSFGGAMWAGTGACPLGRPSVDCPTWAISPSESLTASQKMSTNAMYILDTPLRAFSMYVNADAPGLPAAGSYTPSWTLTHAGRMTHLAAVIAPAR
jgi:hypothetical protein